MLKVKNFLCISALIVVLLTGTAETKKSTKKLTLNDVLDTFNLLPKTP